MFIVRTGICNALRWKEILGLEPNGLSPLPAIVKDFEGESASDQGTAVAGIAEEELSRALAILWSPERLITLRCGGNLVVPEQMRIYRAHDLDPTGLAMVIPTPFDTMIVQYFADTREWAQWATQMVDPAGLAQVGERVSPGVMDFGELLHLLHTADMYRRLYYESMLDYIPAGELTFSAAHYAEAMHNAVTSGDYRWLVPCLLYMLPNGRPVRIAGIGARFASMEQWGLITSQRQEEGDAVCRFTQQGTIWGLEFMTRWISAMGVTVATVNGDSESGDRGLFLLGTTLSIHAFHLWDAGGNASIEHTVLDGEGATRLLEAHATLEAAGGVTEPAPSPVPEPSADVPYSSESSEPVLIRCTQCGCKVGSEDRFCIECGAEIIRQK
jgi:hypothetical protein